MNRPMPYRIKRFCSLLALGVLVGCGKSKKPTPPPATPVVTITEPVLREVSEYEELPGRIEAIDRVQIRARVNGELLEVKFEEGAEVEQGEALFQIDPREYQAKVEIALAGVERAEAGLAQATSDFDRAKRLGETRAIAEQTIETLSTSVLEATGSLRAAKATLAQAQLDLDYTSIVSPIAGRISSLAVTRGNLIESGATLTSVVRQEPVYVTFEMPERIVLRWDEILRDVGGGRLAERVDVNVGLLNEAGHPHRAVMNFVDNSVAEATGTLKLRAQMENFDRNARVGLFARVRLSLKLPRSTLLVPERAVGVDQGRRFVYIVGEDDQIEYRRVVPGQVFDGMLAISEGVEEGDRIVTEGLLALKAGMKVKPETAPEA